MDGQSTTGSYRPRTDLDEGRLVLRRQPGVIDLMDLSHQTGPQACCFLMSSSPLFLPPTRPSFRPRIGQHTGRTQEWLFWSIQRVM